MAKLPVLPVFVRGPDGLEQRMGFAKTLPGAVRKANGEIISLVGDLCIVRVTKDDVHKEPGCSHCGHGKRFVVTV